MRPFTPFLIAVVLSGAMAISFAGTAQFSPANTLGDLLQANGVRNLQDLAQDILAMYIGAGNLRFYDAVSNDTEFVFAGYLLLNLPGPRDQPIERRIHVVSADKVSGRVRYAAVPAGISGSISKILPAKAYLYISTHLNPSAGNMFVLTRDLKVQRELYGYPEAVLASDSIVFHNSQIHFAPTHIAELSVYDPIREIEIRIYPPMKPDAARLDFIGRVRAAYAARGADWFRINNHHMDPERFDSSLVALVVDETAHTLSFLVRYDNPINDSADPRASREDVVATCTGMDRVERISCKERSLDAWASALMLSKAGILNEPYDSRTGTNELLRRAASRPDTVP